MRRARVARFVERGEQLTDEQADAVLASPQGRQLAAMMRYSAVGTPTIVKAYLDDFAVRAGADELIVVHAGPTRADRLRSLDLLADVAGLVPASPGGADPDGATEPDALNRASRSLLRIERGAATRPRPRRAQPTRPPARLRPARAAAGRRRPRPGPSPASGRAQRGRRGVVRRRPRACGPAPTAGAASTRRRTVPPARAAAPPASRRRPPTAPSRFGAGFDAVPAARPPGRCRRAREQLGRGDDGRPQDARDHLVDTSPRQRPQRARRGRPASCRRPTSPPRRRPSPRSRCAARTSRAGGPRHRRRRSSPTGRRRPDGPRRPRRGSWRDRERRSGSTRSRRPMADAARRGPPPRPSGRRA